MLSVSILTGRQYTTLAFLIQTKGGHVKRCGMVVNNQQLLSCSRTVTLTPTFSPPPRLMFLAGPDGEGLLKTDLVYMRMYEVLICDIKSVTLLVLSLATKTFAAHSSSQFPLCNSAKSQPLTVQASLSCLF